MRSTLCPGGELNLHKYFTAHIQQLFQKCKRLNNLDTHLEIRSTKLDIKYLTPDHKAGAVLGWYSEQEFFDEGGRRKYGLVLQKQDGKFAAVNGLMHEDVPQLVRETVIAADVERLLRRTYPGCRLQLISFMDVDVDK